MLVSGSQTVANYVTIFVVLLIAPLVVVSQYWAYRLDFRPYKFNPQESKNISRSSFLLPTSSLFLMGGVVTWQRGWVFSGSIVLLVYVVVMAFHVRLVWCTYRSMHARLGLHSGSSSTLSLTRVQKSNLLWIIVFALLVNLFSWTGLYLIFDGRLYWGTATAVVGAFLCSPLIRRIQRF